MAFLCFLLLLLFDFYTVSQTISIENGIKMPRTGKYTFDSSHKHWFYWVAAFIEKKMGNCQTVSFVELLKSNLNQARHFASNNNFELNHIRCQKANKIKIIKPLGFVGCWGLLTVHNSKINHLWMFNLMKSLRIRLTFLSLTFEYLHFKSCLFGNLTIRNKHSFLFNTTVFTYCGIYSGMPNFPPYTNVYVLLGAKSILSFNTTFSFSITDESIISCQVVTNRANGLQSVLHFTKQQVNLFVLLLKAHLYQVVLVTVKKTKLSSVKIYDGPEKIFGQAAKLRENKTTFVYTTSTVYCLIYMWTDQYKNYSVGLDFLYTIGKIHKELFFSSDSSLPNFQLVCQNRSKVCVIRIKTKNKMHVNATTTGFIYSGQNDASCSFAGAAFYNMENNKIRQLGIDCVQFYGLELNQRNYKNSYRYRFRSHYSHSEELLLVLFALKLNQSVTKNIKIDIALSTTSCYAVKIDPCNFTYISPKLTIEKFYHDIEVVSKENMTFSDYQTVDISLKDNSCLVIQLHNQRLRLESPLLQDNEADKLHSLFSWFTCSGPVIVPKSPEMGRLLEFSAKAYLTG